MNCPKCKNPIEDNVNVCEWCGVTITSQKASEYNLDAENYLKEYEDAVSEVEIWQLKMGKVDYPDSLRAKFAHLSGMIDYIEFNSEQSKRLLFLAKKLNILNGKSSIWLRIASSSILQQIGKGANIVWWIIIIAMLLLTLILSLS